MRKEINLERKLAVRTATLLLVSLNVFGLLSTVRASTYVCGVASGEWTKTGSPYILTCDVLAADLQIRPGVTVSASNFTFEVGGVLKALGTQTEPIVFQARDPAVGWKGIFFNYSSPGSEMQYCIVSNANNSGLRILNSVPRLSNCTLTANSTPSYPRFVSPEVKNADFLAF